MLMLFSTRADTLQSHAFKRHIPYINEHRLGYTFMFGFPLFTECSSTRPDIPVFVASLSSEDITFSYSLFLCILGVTNVLLLAPASSYACLFKLSWFTGWLLGCIVFGLDSCCLPLTASSYIDKVSYSF